MAEFRATVCLTFDFDAISLWIGSFGATSPSMISRGEFGPIGVERILGLLARTGIRATFFVPGHTADTYPESVRAIAAAGHEIGHHGYLHENPAALESVEQEAEVLRRGLAAPERVAGVRSVGYRGYRSPSWDNSAHTVELLCAHGFRYESSLMGNDFMPYWCRAGDVLEPDGRYRFGAEVDLVELPVNWLLDDFPHFEYVRIANRVYPGLSAPAKVEEIWRQEFAYMYREIEGGVFTVTMHPQVIGRGHRMLMLERLINAFAGYDGVRFATLAQVADEFRAAHPLSNVDPA